MAGFDISSSTNTFPLRRTRDGTATGEASFTVANQTGHAVRARVTPVAEGTTDPAWLDVAEPGAERNFKKDGTDAFIVLITVPPTATAGDHLFRLDAASVSLPDEEWGRGNPVRFQVPETTEPEPEPEEEPPGYVETVGGALVGGVAVAVLTFGIGLAIAVATTAAGGGGGTGGGDIGEIIGNAIGSAIAFVIVLAFIAIAFGLLGAWLGPVAGAFLVLRFRGFKDPWLTAGPMVILVPLIGLPIFIAGSAVGDATGMSGAIQGMWLVLVGILALSAPALAARAFARWRQTGHL